MDAKAIFKATPTQINTVGLCSRVEKRVLITGDIGSFFCLGERILQVNLGSIAESLNGTQQHARGKHRQQAISGGLAH
jgi:hypothetical protein